MGRLVARSVGELYHGCELIWQQLEKRSVMMPLVASVLTLYFSCCTAFEDFRESMLYILAC